MPEVTDQLITASRQGVLWAGFPASRWVGAVYQDGEGGVVWVENGLWLAEIVPHHPAHQLPAPTVTVDDEAVFVLGPDEADTQCIFKPQDWQDDVGEALATWKTMPEGWREGRGLEIARTIAPKAEA